MADQRKFFLKERKILIYGAGSLGMRCNGILKTAGIDVEAYIDKRADTFTECAGRKILRIEELNGFEHKEEYCIIVAIRNVFEHSQLVLQFYDMGFRFFIYKPVTVLQGRANEVYESISRAYDCMMDRLLVPDEPVFQYEKEKIFTLKDGAQIACNREGYRKVYLSAELLFSNVLADSIWSERNFITSYIGVDLYRAFQAGGQKLNDSIENYVERFAKPGALENHLDVSGEWASILIGSRLAVYNEMCNRMAVSPAFFVDNCTTVEMRQNGGFRLTASGKNRVSFLISRGYRYIPVFIKREDYERSIRLECVQKLESYLEENAINELTVPIPHPYFMDFKYRIPQYVEQWQSRVGHILCEAIYRKDKGYCFEKYTVLDNSDDDGSISRFLCMLGFNVEREKEDAELVQMLDELQGVAFKRRRQVEEIAYIYMNIGGDNGIIEDGMLSKVQLFFVLEEDAARDSAYGRYAERFPYEKEILHALWMGRYVTGRVLSRELFCYIQEP